MEALEFVNVAGHGASLEQDSIQPVNRFEARERFQSESQSPAPDEILAILAEWQVYSGETRNRSKQLLLDICALCALTFIGPCLYVVLAVY